MCSSFEGLVDFYGEKIYWDLLKGSSVKQRLRLDDIY